MLEMLTTMCKGLSKPPTSHEHEGNRHVKKVVLNVLAVVTKITEALVLVFLGET